MLVDAAKKKCEEDLACGGFTFKGSFYTTKYPMEMYFFHVVPLQHSERYEITLWNFLSRYKWLKLDLDNIAFEKPVRYYYWSTYVVDRDFIIIPDVIIKNSSYSKEHNLRYLKRNMIIN